MRILAGFMPATSGTAKIAGFDVFSQSLEVRRNIGYMPENVPLYPDMRVDEFLAFRAALKGVSGRRVTARVGQVKELCGLTDMGRKIVGQLSKGYKQRVGLADALVHDPKLLILDEPTIGLDPNQIRQVRDLIKALGKKHTVLISTHILPEVEMTCSRVLILNKGRIEASDTPEMLTSRLKSGGAVKLEVKAPVAVVVEQVKRVEGVDEVKTVEDGDWTVAEVFPRKNEDLREALSALAMAQHWPLRELSRHKATLEDVFVQLTQRDTL
jgi:ABC-2 type transport system ATP-binding protein